MNNQLAMAWLLPGLVFLAAVVVYFTISRSKGIVRLAFATFAAGFAIAISGVALAVYLAQVEVGATVGAIGVLICFVGLGIFFANMLRRDGPAT